MNQRILLQNNKFIDQEEHKEGCHQYYVANKMQKDQAAAFISNSAKNGEYSG